jgi:hypothetical protein
MGRVQICDWLGNRCAVADGPECANQAPTEAGWQPLAPIQASHARIFHAEGIIRLPVRLDAIKPVHFWARKRPVATLDINLAFDILHRIS